MKKKVKESKTIKLTEHLGVISDLEFFMQRTLELQKDLDHYRRVIRILEKALFGKEDGNVSVS